MKREFVPEMAEFEAEIASKGWTQAYHYPDSGGGLDRPYDGQVYAIDSPHGTETIWKIGSKNWCRAVRGVSRWKNHRYYASFKQAWEVGNA